MSDKKPIRHFAYPYDEELGILEIHDHDWKALKQGVAYIDIVCSDCGETETITTEEWEILQTEMMDEYIESVSIDEKWRRK